MIDRRYDPEFCELLAGSYRRLVGRPLISLGMSPAEAARWLYDEAPFAVLAHNTAADPIFIYGNRAAQRCFEYGWEELLVLPSRLSAEPVERGGRQQFMERAGRDGYATGYRGVRIAKSGRRFLIEDAAIWNLLDSIGICHGQAATFVIPEIRRETD